MTTVMFKSLQKKARKLTLNRKIRKNMEKPLEVVFLGKVTVMFFFSKP